MRENVFKKIREMVVFSEFNIRMELNNAGLDYTSVSVSGAVVTITTTAGYDEADNIALHFKQQGFTTQVVSEPPVYKCILTKWNPY